MKLIQKIEKEEQFIRNTVQDILQYCKNKITFFEVLVKKTAGISINVRNGKIENVEFNNDNELFITVYNKFSKGSVSSKDLSFKSMQNMLNIAINISKHSSSDFFLSLPDIELLCFNPINIELFYPWEFHVENAIKFVNIAENEAFKFDKRIINSEGSFFNSYTSINVFGNSLGVLQSYKSTRHSMYNCMIAKDKNSMERDFYYSISRKIDDLEKPEIIGQKTAKKAVSRLGSYKIKTVKSPMIFASEIAHNFFAYLMNAIHGNSVYQKSTFLINDLNKKIFPEWMNIIENPHITKGLGSRPFDNEGISTYKKNIIQQGVLKTWLLNTYNARKLKLKSTGNSGGIYNWIVSHQNISFKELLKTMNTGILITELMGQGVDIINGNYSRGAAGFWIENCQIKHPVNEITISGNLKTMWNNIISISNDVDIRHNIQCGSVLVSEIQISGY